MGGINQRERVNTTASVDYTCKEKEGRASIKMEGESGFSMCARGRGVCRSEAESRERRVDAGVSGDESGR